MTEDFIEDDFNLTGLNSLVPFWKEAMEIVLDVEPGNVGNASWFVQALINLSRGCPEDT